MTQPRLTCPSVWYKRLLLSRTHVEESYSNGLRRWAGYQRFLLQTDDGASAEPFRRMLETLIMDAEQRADAIDSMVEAVGDSDAGVLRRIGDYESLYFKPNRDRLLKRAFHLKKPILPPLSPEKDNIHDNGQTASQNTANLSPESNAELKAAYQREQNQSGYQHQSIEDVKDSWFRLLEERTQHLAESLTEFAMLLSSSPNIGCQDDGHYKQLLDTDALEATRKGLQPLWEEDFYHHLHSVSNLDGHDRSCVCDVKGIETTLKVKKKNLTSKASKESVLSLDPKDFYKSRKLRTNGPTTNRQPAPINTFTVLPALKSSRWSEMGASSALMTPNSRLDLVRKYIQRGDVPKTADSPGSATVETPTRKREVLPLKSSTGNMASKVEIGSPESTRFVRQGRFMDGKKAKEQIKRPMPVVEREQKQRKRSPIANMLQASLDKTLWEPFSQTGNKTLRQIYLPKLPIARSGPLCGAAKLAPTKNQVEGKTSELHVVHVQQPRPFNVGDRTKTQNKRR